jgi:hypothetical protein
MQTTPALTKTPYYTTAPGTVKNFCRRIAFVYERPALMFDLRAAALYHIGFVFRIAQVQYDFCQKIKVLYDHR